MNVKLEGVSIANVENRILRCRIRTRVANSKYLGYNTTKNNRLRRKTDFCELGMIRIELTFYHLLDYTH